MMAKKTKLHDNGTESERSTIKSSWEYRSGKFALRAVAALFFLSYLFAAGPMTWTWGQAVYYKNQPASQIDRLIDEHIQKGDQSKIITWIQMRPPEERASIEEKIARHTATANSFLFLVFSDWALERKDYEQAVFWNFFARYRLRFDALRCGAPNSVLNMKGIVSIVSEEAIDKIVTAVPRLVPATIHKVLEFDAASPANNDPSGICTFIYKLEKGKFSQAPREDWPALRHTLRAVTEYSLSQFEKEPAPHPFDQKHGQPEDTDAKEAE